jgi:hypothetical protein
MPFPSAANGVSSSILSVRLSPALTLEWDASPLIDHTASFLNITLAVSMSAIGGEGWVGLGFGSSMLSSEIALVMLPADSAASVTEVVAADGYAPPTPVLGTGRFTLAMDASDRESGVRRVTLLRHMASFSQSFSSSATALVHSWHTGLDLSYHQNNRV